MAPKPKSHFDGEKQDTGTPSLARRSLDALLNVTRIMGADTNLQNILDGITRNCLDVFDCQQVSIMLLDESTQELKVRSQAGEFREGLLGSTQKVGEGIAGKVAKEGKPVILGKVIDREEFRSLRKQTENISTAMVVPITLRASSIGVLNVTSLSHGHSYQEQDLQVLHILAEIVAICIRHTQQTQWMRETIRGMDSVPDRSSDEGEKNSA